MTALRYRSRRLHATEAPALDVEHHGTVVRVAGEVDLATAPQLRSALEGLEGAPSTRVVVDLSGVDFMDGSGVAALLAAAMSLRSQGKDLVVRHPSRPVCRVLDATRVGDRLAIERRDTAPASGRPDSTR